MDGRGRRGKKKKKLVISAIEKKNEFTLLQVGNVIYGQELLPVPRKRHKHKFSLALSFGD